MARQLKTWTITLIPGGAEPVIANALEVIEIKRANRPTRYVKSLAVHDAEWLSPEHGPFNVYDIREGSEY